MSLALWALIGILCKKWWQVLIGAAVLTVLAMLRFEFNVGPNLRELGYAPRSFGAVLLGTFPLHVAGCFFFFGVKHLVKRIARRADARRGISSDDAPPQS
ncbi:hypothetical protein [Albimonas pacifica]|uniref:Uncharacterized protein n=1 Tax=Albimonas pacifica TaxID=1114924 RepID=A0A1I3JHS0_9RHOB|nr:hypothetical protein [Albimonas pacifica]SFI59724.1 hypothetical protein SAMN05216258_10811 [Albimonas pacifica]